MKTSEAIKLFETQDVTDEQGYNILIEDLWNIGVVTKPAFEDQAGEHRTVTVADMAQPIAQALIQFFMYQIQAVMLPVIRDLRALNAQIEHAGQVFKDELDEKDKRGVN
jgi:hypothetical protein